MARFSVSGSHTRCNQVVNQAMVSTEGSSGKPTHVVVGRIPLPAVVELRASVPC